MGWDLVGYPSDPIPDDPGVVAQQVLHLRNVASTIQVQLDRMPTDGNVESLRWESDAAAGFREVVKKLPKDLGTLRTRYERVAGALDGFNTTLRACKAEVAAGYADAQRASGDAAAARNGVRSMQDHAAQATGAADRLNGAAPPGSPPVLPEPWSGPDYHAMLAQADGALRAAKARVDGAVQRFRDASRSAAKAVDDANHDDLKDDDSLWGSIKRGAHWLAENLPLEAISSILSKISLVAGLLALIPVLAPIFGPIALIAAGLTLLVDLVIQVNKVHEGTFTWGDFALTIGLDTVGVIGAGAAMKVGKTAAGAGGSARAGADDATTAVLKSHVDDAVAKYESGAIGMSRAQAQAAAKNPGLEAAFRGSVIDDAAKATISADPALMHLSVTPRFRFGPDVFDDNAKLWWDMTTEGQWQRHLAKYENLYGTGIRLPTG